MGTARVGLVVAACLALPAWGAGQDLVMNGEFNGNIEHWKIVRGVGDEVWDPLDSQGNPASGSLHLTNTGTQADAATVSGQCIVLTPTDTYEFGTHVFFPPQATGGVAGVVVGWFGNPCCVGTPLAAAASPPVSSTTTNTWVETFIDSQAAPPGTVAVGVGVGLLKVAGASPASAAAALAGAHVQWATSGECPESGEPAASSKAGTGASLEALFDRVVFGHTGTTPVELRSFSVE